MEYKTHDNPKKMENKTHDNPQKIPDPSSRWLLKAIEHFL